MGAQSNALAEHIRQEREELGRDIRELDSMIRQEPERWLLRNWPRIAGLAFGVFLLLGYAIADRRRPKW
jgi:hypothetical protein